MSNISIGKKSLINSIERMGISERLRVFYDVNITERVEERVVIYLSFQREVQKHLNEVQNFNEVMPP